MAFVAVSTIPTTASQGTIVKVCITATAPTAGEWWVRWQVVGLGVVPTGWQWAYMGGRLAITLSAGQTMTNGCPNTNPPDVFIMGTQDAVVYAELLLHNPDGSYTGPYDSAQTTVTLSSVIATITTISVPAPNSKFTGEQMVQFIGSVKRTDTNALVPAGTSIQVYQDGTRVLSPPAGSFVLDTLGFNFGLLLTLGQHTIEVRFSQQPG